MGVYTPCKGHWECPLKWLLQFGVVLFLQKSAMSGKLLSEKLIIFPVYSGQNSTSTLFCPEVQRCTPAYLVVWNEKSSSSIWKESYKETRLVSRLVTIQLRNIQSTQSHDEISSLTLLVFPWYCNFCPNKIFSGVNLYLTLNTIYPIWTELNWISRIKF